MSKQAYENYFRQSAPEGALFGVDISFFQATANGESVDYETAKGYWLDIIQWADFVCIRVSYGANGDDGAQAIHFQLAQELGYEGALGVYHFQHANAGWQANLNNFMARSAPYVDLIDFYMHDYESIPNAGADYINVTCTETEEARAKPVTNYGGKYYWQAAGGVPCPASQFWIAQYPGRSEDAWSLTGVPEMPNQYSGEFPGVWQWQSSTPEHGHLDLNISTTPEAFGIGEVKDMTPEDWARIDARFDTIQRQTEGTIWHLGDFMPTAGMEKARVADRVARILQIDERENSNHFAEVENLNLPLPNLLRLPKLLQSPEFIDAIAKAVVSAMPTDGSGGATEVDYDKIAAIVAAALKKLVLHAD